MFSDGVECSKAGKGKLGVECATVLCFCSALKKLEKAKKAAEDKKAKEELKAKIAEAAPKKAAKAQNAEQDEEDMDPTVSIVFINSLLKVSAVFNLETLVSIFLNVRIALVSWSG